MNDPVRAYSKDVYETTRFRGAYPLVVPLSVGDYLQIGKDDIPMGLGNVRNWRLWDMPIAREAIEGKETYFSGCKREKAAIVNAGVEPPTSVGAEGTVKLSFSKAGGFVLAFHAAEHERYEDIPKAQRLVLDAARAGWWQAEWALVTEVIKAESATLMVSLEKSTAFDLHATVAMPAALALAGVQVADPKLGWTSSGWSGRGFSTICKPGTPLFHCVRIRQRWWGKLQSELQEARDDDLAAIFATDLYEDDDV
jgi:hypothetical protein